jgi:hypothetical protein
VGEFRQSHSRVGGDVEAFIEGEKSESPSVQGYISPSGEVHILSTHDQILGGPDGQIYLGCNFLAMKLIAFACKRWGCVWVEFWQRGAIERYGVDFVAVHQPDNPGANGICSD